MNYQHITKTSFKININQLELEAKEALKKYPPNQTNQIGFTHCPQFEDDIMYQSAGSLLNRNIMETDYTEFNPEFTDSIGN